MSTKYMKGRKKKLVNDELYTCNVNPKRCTFKRYASKLHTSTSSLKNHLEDKHKIFGPKEEGDKSITTKPTSLEAWMSGAGDQPPFEEALLDWIVYTCQLFTVTETKQFKVMMKSGGCQYHIPGADTVSNKLYARLVKVEAELHALLDRTCSTIALSLDGWTSQNSLPMLAINGKWLSPDFQLHQACIEFIEIKGSHSGENLAAIVFKALKKYGLLQKLLTITGD